MNNNFQQVQEALNNRATYEDLDALEKKIMDKIAALLQALANKFADKQEVKKALKALEKQLKNLYDLIMNMKPGGTEQDAMFSKKPLGGFSCASCAKGLTNLQGQIADYQPWSKLPFRDPNERIARYGAGFSKMLSMLRPEQSMQTSWQSPEQHHISHMSRQEVPKTSQGARGSNKKIVRNPNDFNATGKDFLHKRGSNNNRNPKGVHQQVLSVQQHTGDAYQQEDNTFLPQVMNNKDTI